MRLVELAEAIPSAQWVLVGGCMVLCHADMAGVHAVRPTYDLDLVVLPTVSYRSVAAALGSVGYQPHESLDSLAPFHRFSRDADGVGFPVDVMVTETRQASFLNRRVIAAPGTRSIEAHTVEVSVGDALIRIPDLIYALAIKGAALRTDGFSIPKHATDGIELLACITATGTTPAGVSKSMRSNINTMLTCLTDPRRWEGVDETLRELAFRAAVRLRHDWAIDA
jgi:hypothetical protein